MKSSTQSGAHRVNVGVVGLGFMGLTHLRAYADLPEASIVAVSDAYKRPVRGRIPGVSGNLRAADAWLLPEGTRFYEDAAGLLADPEVELVDLCVPTPLHAPLALAALRAGKHVLCEKPLARTVAEARRLVRAAEQAATWLMPAMCMRFWPGWSWLAETIRRGTYGRVLAARFRRVSGPPVWSRATYLKGDASGGALLDLHIHDVDFVRYCFGPPRAVFARGFTRFSGAIDHVVAQYIMEDDAVIAAEGSWIMSGDYPFQMSYTVNFEKATAEFNLIQGRNTLRLFRDGRSVTSIELPETDGYKEELRYMLACIQQGRPPQVVTAEDGLRAVEICAAEEKSVRTGRIVRL
ncbi:MAG: Gfo/Idh/MocA family oxidoreductase [Verrucomicrobiota bacterium]|nr:Gfo/Idh/MocA family oxidoreductase [Limisphaera sp.]MDW8382326.1 Gfo/Idh/MocA family oxidoreductase [Verrucomicrobiota bacterium]